MAEDKKDGAMRPMGLIALVAFMGLMSLVSSCTSHEETLVPTTGQAAEETPISFSGKEGERASVTRAGTSLHEAGVDEFTVWGYKSMSESAGVYGNNQTVFPGYTVSWEEDISTTTNSSGWEYLLAGHPTQTIKFWDWSAAAYRFYAVTGGLSGSEGTYAAGAYKSYDYAISADASSTVAMASTPYYSRLWFSTGQLPTYADKQFGKPVQLEFVKPYARVRFIFSYAYPREGIVLSGVSFKPSTDYDPNPALHVKIPRKGTVTIKYPLTGTATAESYTVVKDGVDAKLLTEFTEDYDPENDAKVYSLTDNGWYSVLPNTGQGSYKLTVSVNGEAKSCVVPAQYMTWQPGYSYTYVFKITDEGGVEIGWVEYAMTPWTEMTADWTVYNW